MLCPVMTPDLKSYRWIVVNSSGGKDSQTALAEVIRQTDALGISRDRIVVSHQDLGHVEWAGTVQLAREQAEHYGLRFEVARYRNIKGQSLGLLGYVRQRRKWPSPSNRYCTSEFKRSPGENSLAFPWARRKTKRSNTKKSFHNRQAAPA